MDTNRENRERYTAKQNAGYKSDWNEIRQQRTQDQATAATDKIDQAQKALTEREQHDKQVNDLGDRLRTVEEQRLKDKENNPAGEKRGTPGQFSGADTKKAQAIAKAHNEYNKATANLPKDQKTAWTDEQLDTLKAAKDDYDQANQDAQDAYENEIVSLGGTAQHFDYASQGKAHMDNSAPNPTAAEKVNELGGRKVGDVGVVRGQRVRITNIYKSGKFDYEPVTAQ